MNTLFDFPFRLFDQSISPVTSWFSPNYEINFAGDKNLEQKIIADVASYGTQLNRITEALLVLAEGRDEPAIQELRKVHENIEQVKTQTKAQLVSRIERDLAKLKAQDAKAYQQLLATLKPGDAE
ncbi:MAG TPA: hypothetical protein PK011_05990 [Marinagarivorans sp.]|nr:hypothetical protein [Cellvibrionaceae bacterium]HMY38855.1 hypothetical protein [Marinagarivorans sp.]HNG58205.1 hypothetical protein [Cellvibrionaceae bacterium]